VEWQIAELQTALHQAELDLEDLLANIAIVPDPASVSPEIMDADQIIQTILLSLAFARTFIHEKTSCQVCALHTKLYLKVYSFSSYPFLRFGINHVYCLML
jgi:hypothetical protein